MPKSAWVRIEYPPAFRMPIDEFAHHAGWQIRRSDGEIWATTIEAYRRTSPDLFRLVRLAPVAAKLGGDQWAALSRMAGQNHLQSDEVRRMVANLREVARPTEPEDPFVAFRLQFMALPDEEVADFGRAQFSQLAQSYSNASAWYIEFADTLQGRLAAARALFGASVGHEQPPSPAAGRLLFPAGLSFMRSQLFGFGEYLEPALLTLSPWITGVSSYRVGGSLIFLFGGVAPGIRPNTQAPELIDLFKPHSYATGGRPVAPPTLDPGHSEAALTWWVTRINHLFAVALDLTRYADATGGFVPARQIGVLMSLERLFLALQTILVTPRDEFVRSTVLFDVLDVLDGLGFDNWERMVTLRHAEAALTELEASMPAEAQPVLLPRCRSAVDALREATQHFVPNAMRGSVVELSTKDGRRMEGIAPDIAYASLLRLTRNASHSYRDHARDPREVSILSSHDGTIRDQLAELGLLHVLRFLTSPRLPAA